jgi:hypothetical protein
VMACQQHIAPEGGGLRRHRPRDKERLRAGSSVACVKFELASQMAGGTGVGVSPGTMGLVGDLPWDDKLK